MKMRMSDFTGELPAKLDHDVAGLYKDYWIKVSEARQKRRYYQRLYNHLLAKIKIAGAGGILDVGGGNGQFLEYLGIKQADIIDISESGLRESQKKGFTAIYGDIEKRFSIAEETYDVVYCFEVLEHLHHPNKTLVEIHHVLRKGGVLFVGQPNMRADGVHHVRRYNFHELLSDLRKSGFLIKAVDYVPAYSMREAILNDIRKNPSFVRKTVQCANLILSYLPWVVRYRMAQWIPDRFALIFIVKAIKK